MPDPMKIRATLDATGKTDVRALINHEMESGQRKDPAGKTIPAWFIQTVTATHNGKVVLSSQWGPAVAKNPTLQFKFSGAKVGDKVVISWVDNRGEKQSNEAIIAG